MVTQTSGLYRLFGGPTFRCQMHLTSGSTEFVPKSFWYAIYFCWQGRDWHDSNANETPGLHYGFASHRFLAILPTCLDWYYGLGVPNLYHMTQGVQHIPTILHYGHIMYIQSHQTITTYQLLFITT